MPTNRLHRALQQLHQTVFADAHGAPTDGQLLACFVATRDEQAFAALVRRHGPMVLGVCRRLLRHEHDAEDAFQATFLVLARKAATVVKREAVASFLYIIAYRTALAARARSARLRAHEKQVENMPHPEVPPPEIADWKPFLDRELSRLDERYRAAVVLCDLEGRSRAEASRQLGVAPGTLSSWLHRARILLAKRLGRYHLVLPAGALASVLADGAATAAVPAGLAATVVKGAALVAAGKSAGAAAPAILMKEVLKTMMMTKLKGYLAAAVVAVLLGVGALSYRAVGQGTPTGRSEPARPLTEMEELRREIDILKLQVELLQNKVRAQGVEIRSLKAGRGTAAVPTTTPPSRPASSGASPLPSGPLPATSLPAAPVPINPPAAKTPPATPLPQPPQPPEAGSGRAVEPPTKCPQIPAPPPADPSKRSPTTAEPPAETSSGAPATGEGPRDAGPTTAPAAPAPPSWRPPGPEPRGAALGESPDQPLGPAAGVPAKPRKTSPEEEAEAALKALRAAPPNSKARQDAVKALERALQQLKQEQLPAEPH
jgi:RNA polymerase sigma factor (sigma-70 family)